MGVIGELPAQMSWLQKNFRAWRRCATIRFRARERGLSLRKQGELLGLNRSGLYRRSRWNLRKELAIREMRHRAEEIYAEHPVYGYRRVCVGCGGRGTPCVQRAPEVAWRFPDQHGREGTRGRQRSEGKVLADDEGGGVTEGVRCFAGCAGGAYHGDRPHQSLGYRTPDEVYCGDVGGNDSGM